MKTLTNKFMSIISPHLKGKKAYFTLLEKIKKNKKIEPNKVINQQFL